MDWLTFITKVVEATAWPVVACICFFALKEQLLRLFPFLRRLKYKEFEAEFGEGLREVSEKLIANVEPVTFTTLPEAIATTGSSRDHFIRLAEVAPRAAILEAWLQIEHAAQRLIRSHGVAERRPLRMVGPAIILDCLDKTSVVTPEQRESFNKLRQLRNKVVHFAEISLPLDEVIEYIDLALSLAWQFDEATKS
ncbi:hypothetical protein JD974_21745 [Chromobacterium haemolyticum]|uniref:DUF4145 domain-containing protein n=1 Tax=Chromobacterium haemolyticum TaxID=394935 RepID=A0ABS3GU61_9NEIS|nr:hypothetical protein [Chromobacterium haemolyticum]MBK0417033.1 hypothetical protein [Chromobacterium haemolyticum]MBO0418159.1 hypothetical protein [Chromobacterium haemolyticum]MBO0501448.1 hypothetical protein [Chromobacterium haemolyticum]OQS30891.1 hypothetical protein B0T40_24285 [Chromobacterium haemolyticum]